MVDAGRLADEAQNRERRFKIPDETRHGRRWIRPPRERVEIHGEQRPLVIDPVDRSGLVADEVGHAVLGDGQSLDLIVARREGDGHTVVQIAEFAPVPHRNIREIPVTELAQAILVLGDRPEGLPDAVGCSLLVAGHVPDHDRREGFGGERGLAAGGGDPEDRLIGGHGAAVADAGRIEKQTRARGGVVRENREPAESHHAEGGEARTSGQVGLPGRVHCDIADIAEVVGIVGQVGDLVDGDDRGSISREPDLDEIVRAGRDVIQVSAVEEEVVRTHHRRIDPRRAAYRRNHRVDGCREVEAPEPPVAGCILEIEEDVAGRITGNGGEVERSAAGDDVGDAGDGIEAVDLAVVAADGIAIGEHGLRAGVAAADVAEVQRGRGAGQEGARSIGGRDGFDGGRGACVRAVHHVPRAEGQRGQTGRTVVDVGVAGAGEEVELAEQIGVVARHPCGAEIVDGEGARVAEHTGVVRYIGHFGDGGQLVVHQRDAHHVVICRNAVEFTGEEGEVPRRCEQRVAEAAGGQIAGQPMRAVREAVDVESDTGAGTRGLGVEDASTVRVEGDRFRLHRAAGRHRSQIARLGIEAEDRPASRRGSVVGTAGGRDVDPRLERRRIDEHPGWGVRRDMLGGIRERADEENAVGRGFCHTV